MRVLDNNCYSFSGLSPIYYMDFIMCMDAWMKLEAVAECEAPGFINFRNKCNQE